MERVPTCRASFRRTPRAVTLLLALLIGPVASAQTWVTPKLGGGQVAADMVHIDILYDTEANQLTARVDDSYGTPELRALEPGLAFDPSAAYAVLAGKSYNAQYGWNVGGFLQMPPGSAIWIEPVGASPELEVYDGWGRTGSHAPIFGTAGSPSVWHWSGVMVHNTYAVLRPTTDRFWAEYHIYFGDPETGSRAGFEGYDDTAVRLEWTAALVDDPRTFRFGAVAPTHGAPLLFIDADRFAGPSGPVLNLDPEEGGGFTGRVPLLALPATAAKGGPAGPHGALGACLELRYVSLDGPAGAQLGVCLDPGSAPLFRLPAGEAAGTNCVRLSEPAGAPGSDPYGRVAEHRLQASLPGLYRLGFQLVDTSTNGPAGGPIHPTSPLYHVRLQAGLTLARLEQHGESWTASFSGQIGRSFYLERASHLGPLTDWQTVAGPLIGTNELQQLMDPGSGSSHAFYRLRSVNP